MRQRKLLLPPFHGESVRRYGELIRELAEREVPPGRSATPFALRPRMQPITLEVILRAVFGLRDPDASVAPSELLVDRLLEGRSPLHVGRRGRGATSALAAHGRVPARPRARWTRSSSRRSRGAEPTRTRRSATTCSRCCCAQPRGRQPDERRGAARRARDLFGAGHETTATCSRLGVRAPASQPRGRWRG